MALSSAIQWEVRTTGSDNNGGGFKYGASGTDYSQQDTAQKSGTDLVIDASDATKVQPGAGVAAADVGNVIQITAGTGFTTGFYEIISQDGTYWTLDREAGTAGSTGGTYAMGGALATPGKCTGAAVAYNTIHVKYGTYNFTTNTSNVSGGRMQVRGSITIVGYNSSRWDFGGRPIFRATGMSSSYAMLYPYDSSAVSITVMHIVFDLNSIASVRGISYSAGYIAMVYDCHIINIGTSGYGMIGNLSMPVVKCYVSGASGAIAGIDSARIAVGCTVEGCNVAYRQCGAMYHCIADGANTDGFTTVAGTPSTLSHCTAYGCGGDAFDLSMNAIGNVVLNSCLAVNCTGAAFRGSTTDKSPVLINCAHYNCSGGRLAGSYLSSLDFNPITLTANPLTDPTNDDFSLNNTSGGGAACRAAGWPGDFPDASYFSTTGYTDIGAVQHQDTPGGPIRSMLVVPPAGLPVGI